ncbi:MAG: 6,7-dimethyl-8-ribityllumazine synthase [Oceanococcus sp.]
MNNIQAQADNFSKDRFAIISTQWNPVIVESLVEAAQRTLLERGVSDQHIDHYVVPGAFEIPLMAGRLAESDRYAGVITLGAVIKGDTAHFEYVAGECARGIADVALNYGVPVGFGVLATYDLQQALDRAGPNEENKGVEAAAAVLDTLNILRSVDG